MDDERFDRIAKALGGAVSRRTAVRAAMAGLLGGLVGAAGVAEARPGKGKSASQKTRASGTRDAQVGTCKPYTCYEQGRQCGVCGDGCGGELDCGSCGPNATCDNGKCVCQYESCGSGDTATCCAQDQTCGPDGTCVGQCNPSCGGKQCGNNGCGGSCGDCLSGTCDANGQCVPPGPNGPTCLDFGASCTGNSQCCSGLICKDGRCDTKGGGQCSKTGQSCTPNSCCRANDTCAPQGKKGRVCIRVSPAGDNCLHVGGRPGPGQRCCERLHEERGRCVINRWDHCDPKNGQTAFCERGTTCEGGRNSPHGTPVCVPKGYRTRKRKERKRQKRENIHNLPFRR